MLDAGTGGNPVSVAASLHDESAQEGGVVLLSVVNGGKFHFLYPKTSE